MKIYIKPTISTTSASSKVNTNKLPSMFEVEKLLKNDLPSLYSCTPIIDLDEEVVAAPKCNTPKKNYFSTQNCAISKLGQSNSDYSSSAFTAVSNKVRNSHESEEDESPVETTESHSEKGKNTQASFTEDENTQEDCVIKINISTLNEEHYQVKNVSDVEKYTEETSSVKSTLKKGSEQPTELSSHSYAKCHSARRDVVYQTTFRYLRKFYQFMYNRFTKVKGEQYKGKKLLMMFAIYLNDTFKLKNVNLIDLMIHIGSIIYPSNLQKLEQKLANLKSSSETQKAKCQVALSILKFREITQKFNMEKMNDFLGDHINKCLFKIYLVAMQSGRYELPDVMQKNKEIYLKAFESINADLNASA